MASCTMIVEHIQNNKLQKLYNFQSLTTSFLKNLKMNISSLIWTVENSALQWTVERLVWMFEESDAPSNAARVCWPLIGRIGALTPRFGGGGRVWQGDRVEGWAQHASDKTFCCHWCNTGWTLLCRELSAADRQRGCLSFHMQLTDPRFGPQSLTL